MLTYGSDPEYFLSYKKDGVDYVEPPAYFREVLGVDYFIPQERRKEEVYRQHPVFIAKDGIQIIEDGVAFEYTIPPANNAKDLFNSINLAHNMLGEISSKYGYELYKKPVIKFDCFDKFNPDFIPDEFFSCMIFGCDRDEDAIDIEYQGNTLNVKEHDFRYGGGHLHVGSFEPEIVNIIKDNYRNFIRMLAILVGNTCIKESPYPELEKARAFHYGKPGRFRIQPHGIEYRTPSNSWTSNLETVEKIIDLSRQAFNIILEQKEEEYIQEYLDPTIEAIRNADQELSSQILSSIGV